VISHAAASAVCRAAEARIRQLAEAASHDLEGDVLCCWDTERLGGVDRVIAIRQFPDGTDDEIVAVPLYAGVAEHIAAWDPVVARSVADVLENAAVLIDVLPAHLELSPSQSLAVRLAEAFMAGQP
jgi:hypothetical protein